jgi:phage terminase small subunit
VKILRPPGALKAAAKKFWKKVLSEYVLSDAHDLQRLALAAGCLDEIAGAEIILRAEGYFTLDRYGGRRENPAAKSVRENKIIFCRIIRELGLDLEGAKESRPTRQY